MMVLRWKGKITETLIKPYVFHVCCTFRMTFCTNSKETLIKLQPLACAAKNKPQPGPAAKKESILVTPPAGPAKKKSILVTGQPAREKEIHTRPLGRPDSRI
mgnify:CR=1 FL=1